MSKTIGGSTAVPAEDPAESALSGLYGKRYSQEVIGGTERSKIGPKFAKSLVISPGEKSSAGTADITSTLYNFVAAPPRESLANFLFLRASCKIELEKILDGFAAKIEVFSS